MSEIAGQIQISFQYRDQRIRELKISSSRPTAVAELFSGKSLDQASAMLPLLYTVCGTAQQVAMGRAIEQALGLQENHFAFTCRELLVSIESARELLFRLIKDWLPESQQRLAVFQQWHRASDQQYQSFRSELRYGAIECSPENSRESIVVNSEAQQMAGLLQAALKTLLGTEPSELPELLNSIDPEDQQAEYGEALSVLWQLQQQYGGIVLATGCEMLPDLHQPELRQILENELYIDSVTDQQLRQRYETGCYAAHIDQLRGMQQKGWHIVVQRYAAVLLELCRIYERLRLLAQDEIVQSVTEQSDGVQQGRIMTGYGVVDTARGQLLHRVEIQEGKITKYRILAPTDWNLHPQGMIYRSLADSNPANAEAALGLVRTLVLLADPCVAFNVQLTENKEVLQHA